MSVMDTNTNLVYLFSTSTYFASKGHLAMFRDTIDNCVFVGGAGAGETDRHRERETERESEYSLLAFGGCWSGIL